MNATLALIAGLLWLIAANLLAMLPSRDHHWANAYRLIAVGVPVLIWIAFTKGLLWAAVFLFAGASLLRWPLLYLWRWVKTRFA